MTFLSAATTSSSSTFDACKGKALHQDADELHGYLGRVLALLGLMCRLLRILDSRDCVRLEKILEVLHSLLLVKITLDKVLEGSLGDATDL